MPAEAPGYSRLTSHWLAPFVLPGREEVAGVLPRPVPEGTGRGAGDLLDGVRDRFRLVDQLRPVGHGMVGAEDDDRQKIHWYAGR